jgi:hypothetical protein
MRGGDMTPREERVRARAQRLWQEAGRPEGRDEEFWHRAEREIAIEDHRGKD